MADPDDPTTSAGGPTAPLPDDRIALRANATKWVWVTLGSLVFVLAGGVMVLSETTGGVAKALGWVLVLLFGMCLVVALRQMINPGALIIGSDSIETLARRRLTTYELRQCGPFGTWRNPSRNSWHVVFDYRQDSDDDPIHRANRQLMGGSRVLFEHYGVPAEELAEMLERARQRALTADA
ncbi:MAG TPA: hypothetical protein PLV68_10310 [Ilumatobacteraceae bacterium]|nr:hypothetical protein [Ilumatobacteraceae bacterium]